MHECAVEIGDQVGGVFEADREAEQIARRRGVRTFDGCAMPRLAQRKTVQGALGLFAKWKPQHSLDLGGEMGKFFLTPHTGTLDVHFAREFRKLTGAEYSVAVAFLTEPGYQRIKKFPRFRSADARLVIGLGNFITSPAAIRAAIHDGASIRLVPTTVAGIFHPKLYIISHETAPQALYIGSANGTKAAFTGNTELGYYTTLASDCVDALELFDAWYDDLRPPSTEDIDDYARKYTRANNRRVVAFDDVANLADLALTKTSDIDQTGDVIRTRPVPKTRLLDAQDARTAWVSLQSFTGEYRLQVEIPAAAAAVLTRLGLPERGRIPFRCEDNTTRELTYAFYGDNGMFRINIPNEFLMPKPFVKPMKVYCSSLAPGAVCS
jgi:HKD family nuclease